jgi:hypothetical protein
MWLWCRDLREENAEWRYKGDFRLVKELWRHLLAVPHVRQVFAEHTNAAPISDDQLDARVAYALGRLWFEKPDEIILLGNLDAGTFLLPRVQGLAEAFAAFVTRSA